MFAGWHSKRGLELFDYIAKARAAGRELHITGFDIQDVARQPGTIDELKRTSTRRTPPQISAQL